LLENMASKDALDKELEVEEGEKSTTFKSLVGKLKLKIKD